MINKLAYILLALSFSVGADTVTYIYDGDTLNMRINGVDTKVRLIDIDAPEHDQPYGVEAAQALAALCLNQPAAVVGSGYDQYGRLLGQVICNSTNANLYQIRKGWAWSYTLHPTLDDVRREATAYTNRRGLWASLKQGINPTPPWQWRREHPAP